MPQEELNKIEPDVEEPQQNSHYAERNVEDPDYTRIRCRILKKIREAALKNQPDR